MSAFECNVTPTRLRNAKKRNEDKEPTVIDLRPFSGKAIVSFEDVPITKIAKRIITILNPFTEKLNISIVKKPKAEYNLALEWLSHEIPAESHQNLEIIWNPLKVYSVRETIEIVDQFGNKKSVAIILKSCELKKMRKTGSGMDYNKKLRLKAPSPPKIYTSNRHSVTKTTMMYDNSENFVMEHKETLSYESPKRKQSTSSLIAIKSPLRNATNIKAVEGRDENIAQHESRKNTQVTPINTSNLFNSIKFTPLTETKPKCESKLEYLTSLPTPTITLNRNDISLPKDSVCKNLINNGISPEISSSERSQKTPQIISRQYFSDHTENMHDTTPIRSYAAHSKPSYSSKINSNMIVEEDEDCTNLSSRTYVKGPPSSEEINEIEIILTTDSSSTTDKTSPFLTIERREKEAFSTESQQTDNFHLQATFHVNKSQSFNEILISDTFDCKHSLRTLSESMKETQELSGEAELLGLKINQGSLPNLNDISVREIEHNRYFYCNQTEMRPQNLSIESVVSNTDFKEFETCAQSSRNNLNEIGLPRKQVPKSNHSPLNRTSEYPSPTVRRIKEDDYSKSPQKTKLMTFSPPRNKLSDLNDIFRRETFTVSSSGRDIRATTWKQQQNQHMFVVPKVPRDLNIRQNVSNIISQSLTSLTSSNTSIASTQSMPSSTKKLYNENLINAYKKKDPFSATTTEDPFLSSSMYLDEQTLDGIEKSFKKWLNALVTIPQDLESDRNEKVDVAKLFNEVQNKELTLAPTKELVCSQYYTARLDLLRSIAVRLFHSDEISKPLNKLAVIINEKKLLEVHSARSIHLDIVLQRSLLELLLCFNPLWLRIGLEVVFNVQLNLQSNRDILGMSRFIICNMFKSPYLQQKYNKYHQQEELIDKLRKHTAKNFLFLLFFLDRAKENRLIKQNPCLFIKKAPYKESTEILKKFASLVLANYGDIIRMMKRMDYILTHKQTVIDEFDYAFKNLAVDLRDGVRLTKVMEVILLRDDLIKRVRVPAISRLQKVHNVELALKALEAAEYKILGNITAKDIADGHREKTLSLLWQIIYKFRAPRFNAAAKTIQKFWRTKWLEIAINRRILFKKEQKFIIAATKIQRWYRSLKESKNLRKEFLLIKKTVKFIEERVYASRLMRKQYSQYRMLKESTTLVQRRFRANQEMRPVRAHYLKQRTAIIVLQKWIRSFKEMRILRNDFLLKKKMVKFIENLIVAKKLMKLERERFTTLKRVTIVIQRKFRANKLMNIAQQEYKKQKNAIILIQKWYRSTKETIILRKEFLLIKKTVLTVETRIIANRLMKEEKSNFIELKRITIFIQRRFRAHQQMIHAINEYREQKNATIFIQRWYRSIKQTQKLRFNFLMLKNAVIVIERQFIANKLMKIDKLSYNKLKAATIFIQQRFRANRNMQIEKSSYQIKRNAVIVLQKWFRTTRDTKRLHAEFLAKKNAVLFIESHVIANKMMKEQRVKYIALRKVTILAQQRFRANQIMKIVKQDYEVQKNATITIQKWFRSSQETIRLRNEFLLKKKIVRFIETRIIAKRLMQNEQQKFLELRKVTIIIQQRFRARQNMILAFNEYQKKKRAAILIQKWLRSQKETLKCRHEFLMVKRAVKIVESRIITNRLMKIDRLRYIELRKTTIFIQRLFIANKKMKIAKTSFLSQKIAAIKIQRYYRAIQLKRIAVSEYNNQKNAAKTIQNWFRSLRETLKLRMKFLSMKNAVQIVENRIIANKKMQKERSSFVELRKATIFLQRRFHANRKMLSAQLEFKKQKNSAVVIQKWFRSTQLTIKLRKEFLMKKKTVRLIEERIIANRLMKNEVTRFNELRQNVVYIQQRYRSKLNARYEHQTYQQTRTTVMKIQTHSRGYLARTRFKEMQTPEKLEERRQHKAARKIQAAYRGYKVRSKKSNRCFRVIVERLIKASKNVDPSQTLAAKLKISIDFLKTRYDSNVAISTLAKIEYMSRTVPWILNDNAEFIAAFCYGVMAQAIRSEVDKQIIELCSCIILNLGRYHGTKEDAFQESGLNTIAHMLLRWCDKDCGIFNTLCSLIWVFSHCNQKKKIIKNFMMMKDGEYIMSQIKQNVARKENMRKNSRRPIGYQSISLVKYKKDYQLQLRHQPQTVYSSGFITPEMMKQCRQLPTLESDYGVVRKHPYIFYSSIFAFDTVLKSLNINSVK